MTTNWEQVLKDRLKLDGHRNWVVIADSAYPASPSKESRRLPLMMNKLLWSSVCSLYSVSVSTRPAIYTDEELRFVPEEDAPGITLYRNQLACLLSGYEASFLPHEEIIAMLDRVGETFRVL